MRFYKQPHALYAGIDLHARSMFIHILDEQGQTRFEQDRPARPARTPSQALTGTPRRTWNSPRRRERLDSFRTIAPC